MWRIFHRRVEMFVCAFWKGVNSSQLTLCHPQRIKSSPLPSEPLKPRRSGSLQVYLHTFHVFLQVVLGGGRIEKWSRKRKHPLNKCLQHPSKPPFPFPIFSLHFPLSPKSNLTFPNFTCILITCILFKLVQKFAPQNPFVKFS